MFILCITQIFLSHHVAVFIGKLSNLMSSLIPLPHNANDFVEPYLHSKVAFSEKIWHCLNKKMFIYSKCVILKKKC